MLDESIRTHETRNINNSRACGKLKSDKKTSHVNKIQRVSNFLTPIILTTKIDLITNFDVEYMHILNPKYIDNYYIYKSNYIYSYHIFKVYLSH